MANVIHPGPNPGMDPFDPTGMGSIEPRHFYDRQEGVGFIETLTPAEVDIYWEQYNKEFAPLNEENPCRQSFDEDEFRAVINDPGMLKFAYVKEGEVVSLCMMSGNMDHFPWLSQKFYEKKYPEQFAKDKIHYYIGIFTQEDKRGQGYISDVLDFMTDLYKLEDDPPVITFDCCAKNAEFLPGMIEAVVDGAGAHLEFEELGSQHYYAGQLVTRAATTGI